MIDMPNIKALSLSVRRLFSKVNPRSRPRSCFFFSIVGQKSSQGHMFKMYGIIGKILS